MRLFQPIMIKHFFPFKNEDNCLSSRVHAYLAGQPTKESTYSWGVRFVLVSLSIKRWLPRLNFKKWLMSIYLHISWKFIWSRISSKNGWQRASPALILYNGFITNILSNKSINNDDTFAGNTFFSPFDAISGSLGILSIMNDIFLQFGWPITWIILTSWSSEFDPLKMGLPRDS